MGELTTSCAACGKDIATAAWTCPHCGRVLPAVRPPPPLTPEQKAEAERAGQEVTRQGIRALKVLAGLILGYLVLAFLMRIS